MRCWTTKSNYTITQILSGRSNAFLLSKGEKCILIDTGTKAQWGKLSRRILSMGVRSIDYLILTHTHNDHAANANRAGDLFGPRVMAHRNEVGCLTTGRPAIPKGTNLFSRTLVDLFGEMAAPLFRYPPSPCEIIIEGDVFSLEPYEFNAYLLHTPGHSPGSMSLIVEDEIALVGDVMIGRGSRYTYPPFADDPVELMRSWKKLLDTDCNLFIPSHGWANKRSRVEKVFNRKIKQLKLPAQLL